MVGKYVLCINELILNKILKGKSIFGGGLIIRVRLLVFDEYENLDFIDNIREIIDYF